ncbi:outer membrane cation efflux protein [Janthinobacterium sp. Marseille]|uniref:TolC family protein n=1 Tax=Herminiimonas contaminans TaxID=1111140 RepID=A0ABS0EY60_9BURK|nr:MULTISPECIES: TolC family protein [Oxalobacteraceae]ABR91419.1 outer membrane cation efflux protein [Janthinobacterium sp. Marseille]MBF8179674.1 TolC family protein [Herminiimonas contaminans]
MFLRIQALLNHQSRTLCRTSVLLALVFGTSFVHAQANGLTLNEAVQLSLQRSSLTKAANASLLASRESAAKADQLPDPMLKVGIDNLPVTGSDRYSTTSDFMTMRRVGIEQQWVSSDKRVARSERAQRAVEMEESIYLESVAKVREGAAKAWVNVLYGQRTLALVSAMEKETSDDLNAVNAAHRGAKANASDVMQAQLTLSQAQDAMRKNTQDLRNARLALSRWTGMPAATVSDETPKLTSHVPELPIEELEKYHPMLLTARRAINLADADSTVATRESNPDWSVEAGYSQRGSQYSNMVSFGISIPLPVNRAQKQNRDIAEKSALGTKARMQYEEALRDLQTEIESQSSTLESLKGRIKQLTAQLLPAASQQAELATAAYRSGAGSLSAVFNAKKTLLERRLQIAELEREAALTWAALEYHVVPHDMVSAGEMK